MPLYYTVWKAATQVDRLGTEKTMHTALLMVTVIVICFTFVVYLLRPK